MNLKEGKEMMEKRENSCGRKWEERESLGLYMHA